MDPSLEAGTRIGRYLLEGLLGAGGMAEVWHVTDEMLDRPVALKIVHPKLLSEPEFVARFLREARLAAGLEHPNIPQIFDVGTFEGRPYLVYPLLSGGTLAERLSQPNTTQDMISWLSQIAAALDYAHSQAIVHRDIKPANALFDKKGRLYLTDFGLAKSIKEGPGLTLTGVLVGTPAFMSPEQASGGVVGPAADQYSLGIMAFRMLSGRLPFDNPASPIVIHKILNEALPAARTFRPDLPVAVDRVFAKVLAKKAEGRFLSCHEFVQVLERALDPETSESVLPGVPPLDLQDMEAPASGSVPVDLSSLETGVAPPPRRSKKKRKKRPSTEHLDEESASPPAPAGAPASAEPDSGEVPVPVTPSESRVQRFKVAVSDTDKVSVFDEEQKLDDKTDEIPSIRRPGSPPSVQTSKAQAAPAPAVRPVASPSPTSSPLMSKWTWIAAGAVIVVIAGFFLLRSSEKPADKRPAVSTPVSESAPLPTIALPAMENPDTVSPALPVVSEVTSVPEIDQERLVAEGAILESATVSVSADAYIFMFSFDRPITKPKAKDLKVSSIKVLSRGGKDLISQSPRVRTYSLEIRGATGNVLSTSLKVAATDFKGENLLMTGDTLRLDWAPASPLGKSPVFALISAKH